MSPTCGMSLQLNHVIDEECVYGNGFGLLLLYVNTAYEKFVQYC